MHPEPELHSFVSHVAKRPSLRRDRGQPGGDEALAARAQTGGALDLVSG